MKKKIVGIFVCMLVIAIVLPAVGTANVHNAFSTDLGLIRIKIVATVTEVSDSDNLLGGTIHLNDIITGKYIYDSGAPDVEPNVQIGFYMLTSSPCGIEVKAGGFVFKTDPSNVQFYICIYNDFDYYGNPPFDLYSLWSDKNLPLSNGMLVNSISWELDDATANALSSADLPTTAPVLSDWGSGYDLRLSGEDPSNSYRSYTITAHVTEATKKKAVDVYGVESDWRTPSVTMPYFYNLPFMQFWMKIFERFPNAFPILQHLLGCYLRVYH